jgi:hypothetical protein
MYRIVLAFQEAGGSFFIAQPLQIEDGLGPWGPRLGPGGQSFG